MPNAPRRRVLPTFLQTILLTILAFPACVWADASADAAPTVGPIVGPIRIGVSGPFSGGSAPMGESMRNGIRLAVDEINRIGGVNGRRIELVERDDEANPETGAKIAQEFVQLKVAAALGIVNTGVGLASIDTYQRAKIPLMVAVSTGTSLTRRYAPPAAQENYIFRVSPTLDLEARVLVADLKHKGLSRVAILADSTAYGDAGLKAFQEQCRTAGIAISSAERFNVGDADMSAQVAAARASGAQALVAWGIGPELAAIARNRESAGWKVPLVGSWTFSMRNFIDAAGRAGEGTLMPQTFIQDIGVTSKNSFLLSYRRMFNTERIPSPMSAAQGYDGMHLLFRALLQAGSTEGTRIREALENLRAHYQGAISNYSKPFSTEDHDAITQNMLVMGVVSSGRVDFAYADDRRRGALVRTKAR
jgi:branched-chain amino acid transport system substrate-binding protein